MDFFEGGGVTYLFVWRGGILLCMWPFFFGNVFNFKSRMMGNSAAMATATLLSTTTSGGVGTFDFISTSTSEGSGQTKQGPRGGVMWILCCLASGSIGTPNTMFASLRCTRLEGRVPRG